MIIHVCLHMCVNSHVLKCFWQSDANIRAFFKLNYVLFSETRSLTQLEADQFGKICLPAWAQSLFILYFPVVGLQHTLLCLHVYIVKWYLNTNTLAWAIIWIILKSPRYLKKILFLTIVLSKEVGDNVKLTELPVVKPSVTIAQSVSQANLFNKDITAISFIFN